jgi:hypothetical protein
MKRLLKKLDLTTPATIYIDDDTKQLSVELGGFSPRQVEVEGGTVIFQMGSPRYEGELQ